MPIHAQIIVTNPENREPLVGSGAMDVWKQLRQCKDMKMGTLVGEDEHGNRYFENKDEQFGRDRYSRAHGPGV